MSNLNKRLEALEGKINPRGSWGDRVTLQEKIDRWKAAEAAGLHLDFETGELVTLEEYRRRDPEGAALFECNHAQMEEVTLDHVTFDGDSRQETITRPAYIARYGQEPEQAPAISVSWEAEK